MPTVAQRFSQRVFARDGAWCFYCGRADRPLTLDHVVPKHAGGKSSFDNLVPACQRCNIAKSDKTVEQVRRLLVFSMLDWPTFTPKQMDWLRAAGFDMRPYDEAMLPCELRDVPKATNCCQGLIASQKAPNHAI